MIFANMDRCPALATLVGELWYSRDWWPSRPSMVAVWLWPTHCDEWTLWPGLKKQIMQPLCPSICTHKTMFCYKSQM